MLFCRDCVDDLSQCPVCDLPSHAKDVQTDRQLATAASLCQKLNHMILLCDDTSSGEDEPSTFLLKLLKCLFFIK